MKKKRKNYSEQFKLDAVKLITEQGYKVSEAALSLGIHGGSLRRWKKRLESGESNPFPGNGKMSSEKEELVNLRKEVRRLKMEKEILKKAAAFFARESL